MPDSPHEMEMVGRATVAPAAGDVNWTSAKAQGTSAANSQANRRIMMVVSAGSEAGQPVVAGSMLQQPGGPQVADVWNCLPGQQQAGEEDEEEQQ